MAIDHLALPSYTEPPPRIPVVARYCGPIMAALRRHSGGYRFESPADRPHDTHAWLGRTLPPRR